MTESQDPDARAAERAAERLFKRYEDVRPRDSFELALLHAALDAVSEAKPAFEARVRAEVAEERAKIAAAALLAAREDLHGVAVRLRAKADETGDKTHLGTAAGVALACFRLAELSDRAGSSPDTTPEPLKVKVITAWPPFSVEAENYTFTDEQRTALAGHEDHQTAGAWSAFGWRELRCTTCDLVLWSITTPEGS